MRLLIKVEPFSLRIFFCIKMAEHDSLLHDSLLDHLLETKHIRDELKSIDREMEVEDIFIISLKSLPPPFDILLRH